MQADFTRANKALDRLGGVFDVNLPAFDTVDSIDAVSPIVERCDEAKSAYEDYTTTFSALRRMTTKYPAESSANRPPELNEALEQAATLVTAYDGWHARVKAAEGLGARLAPLQATLASFEEGDSILRDVVASVRDMQDGADETEAM